ncbi:NUDIX domain-containing protein [Urechidicola croceus]|uniref:GDP-mannose pyrophosphatase n=1 Tax=Urechidicola croceus TaxID=1850246 RepID=A0A1D8P7B1_9FLAO|nr:NUDIX hydrolase [Urechidicola croceus]AOW20444.1 ADP-ribose pyrophosphatase [Urechidicola croceus]
MTEIKQLATKIVYQNKWMTVREDKIEFPSGQQSIYGVVEKPDFVVIVAIEDGFVHLVEQYRYTVKQRLWEFPQGSWEAKEDIDPLDVAKGELQEETGLTAEEMIYAGSQYLAYGFSSQKYHVFLAKGLTKGTQNLDPEEEGLITSKFGIEEFEQMIINGTIKDATTLCAYSLLKLKRLI